jgi:hypothetical protein
MLLPRVSPYYNSLLRTYGYLDFTSGTKLSGVCRTADSRYLSTMIP